MFVSALPLLIKIVVSFTAFVSFNAFSLEIMVMPEETKTSLFSY